MQNMFKERLSAVMPLEQLELGMDVINLFESVGFTTPFEALQEIMEVSTSNIDSTTYVARIHATLSGALDDMLLSFGVQVTESTPTAYKCSLSYTLAQLPSYYLPAEVLTIVEGTFGNEVIIAELVYLTQGISVEESLEYLFSVKDALIGKINEEMQRLAELSPTTMIDVSKLNRKRVINLNRLMRDYRAKDKLTCLRSLVEAGARSGADFTALVNQHIEELTLIPADHMTIELLGLAVFSDLPPEKWVDATKEAASEFTDLLSDHRLIDFALSDYRTFFEM